MGLDQYAYSVGTGATDHREGEQIAYWRKHPSLQGWMESLWVKKGRPGADADREFNCVGLLLDIDDIDLLERTVRGAALPDASGFFWGQRSDPEYFADDIAFCRKARAELSLGRSVVYDSWF